ncbi:Cytosine permease (plasmid) [Sodalis glossinidius str. 'morsitans']|uniref:Cytosine permease n=2 Tax=Sodalis glossinidius TaxID=63612 RepID=Q2NQ06_SODGM|nr:cytosine permease [Sodalis glossinidius]BAE75769.1 cytosine transporter protein [Sodalis glossinidius str. 'morsitans']CRL46918.1 Cytosine permease [Sodalis glossinidius str. 'morsitans']
MTRSSKNDYAFDRVPLSARVDLFSITLIRIGGVTALAQFMVGATLGHSMSFYHAIFATLLGSLILEFVSLGLGIAGVREGLTTSLLARWCGFGRIGSVLIGGLITISLLGWFGIQNSILAEGISYAFNSKMPFTLSAILSGLILTLLVAFGFRALEWTAKITVPIFFIIVVLILINVLQGNDFEQLILDLPKGNVITLGAGATVVAGGHILGALITPDMSRYCKNEKHVFWMITASIIVSEFVINGVAILVAHALNTSDVVTIMTQSAGWIGLLSVILSAIKINDLNLYSSSIGCANAIEGITNKKPSYIYLTMVLGVVGTVLSSMGILARFVDFLTFLGVLFPPIAGVMLVDYYVLRTSRTLLRETQREGGLPGKSSTPLIGWLAVISCFCGTLIGLIIEAGIPSLNSLIAASFIYFGLSLILKNKY